MPKAGYKKVRINVTANDIRCGSRMSAASCPIARAVNRHLKSGYSARVYDYIKIVKEAHSYYTGMVEVGRVPNPRADWMFDFDRVREVRPTTFSIELLEEVLK